MNQSAELEDRVFREKLRRKTAGAKEREREGRSEDPGFDSRRDQINGDGKNWALGSLIKRRRPKKWKRGED